MMPCSGSRAKPVEVRSSEGLGLTGYAASGGLELELRLFGGKASQDEHALTSLLEELSAMIARQASPTRLVAFAERLNASRAASATAQLAKTPSKPRPAAGSDLYL